MGRFPRTTVAAATAVLATVAAACPASRAADVVWTGGGGSGDARWSNAANWGGVTPSAGDTLIFPGGISYFGSVNDLTDLTVGGIVFPSNNLTLLDLTGNRLNLAGDIVNDGINKGVANDLRLVGGGRSTQGSLNISGAIDTGGFTLTAASGSQTIGGIISGAGGLTSRASSLTLGSANTFTGAVLIEQGTVNASLLTSAGQASSFGAGTGAIGLGSANTSATLVYTGTADSFSGRGLTVGTGGGTINVESGRGLLGIGPVSGGALTKTGGGALRLAGSFAGLSVLGGTVQVANAFSLSTTPILLDGGSLQQTSGGGVFSQTFTLGDGGGTLHAMTVSGAIQGTGGLTKTGFGTLQLRGASSYAGPTLISAGGVLYTLGGAPSAASDFTVAGGTTLRFGEARQYDVGSLAGTGLVGINGSPGQVGLRVGANGTSSTFSGTLDLNGGVTKAGAGTWTLLGAKSFTGGLTVEGGMVAFESEAALGAAGGGVTLSGGGLRYVGTAAQEATDRPVTLLAAGSFVDVANAGSTLALTGTASGTGGIAKNGAGRLLLTGANTYSGGTDVRQGTLAVAGDGALGSGGLTLRGGTTLELTGGPRTLSNHLTLAGGTATITGDTVTFTGGGTLTGHAVLSVENGQTTLGGTFGQTGGARSLVKTGTGTLTLTGANTFSGGVLVAEGTLRVANATGSATGRGAVTIAEGATLTGSGTISGAVQINGTFSPGDSPGLATTGSQVWGEGGTYLWEIGDADGVAGVDWDMLRVNGTLTLGATAADPFRIVVSSLVPPTWVPGAPADFDPARAYAWTIAEATGGVLDFDPAAFLLDVAGFSADTRGGTFGLTQDGGAIRVTFTPGAASAAVPEPGTLLFVLLAAVPAAAAWRRQGGRCLQARTV